MLWVALEEKASTGQKGGSGQNRVARCPWLAVSPIVPFPNFHGALEYLFTIASAACRISETISAAGTSSTRNLSEFHRHISNAGMLQSGMPHLARFQEFHQLSAGHHRVLERQSGDLKRKNPGPKAGSNFWPQILNRWLLYHWRKSLVVLSDACASGVAVTPHGRCVVSPPEDKPLRRSRWVLYPWIDRKSLKKALADVLQSEGRTPQTGVGCRNTSCSPGS